MKRKMFKSTILTAASLWVCGGVMADNGLIRVEAGNAGFELVLYDNDSTRALKKGMPMSVKMEDLNGNEKFYRLPNGLPTDSTAVRKIRAGDFMLYGSDTLVLFYEDFNSGYSYTKLGYVSDPSGLKEALGKGSVNVIFTIKQERD